MRIPFKTINKHTAIAAFIASLFVGSAAQLSAQTVWLDELDLSHMSTGWGIPQANKSAYGKPLRIAGTVFDRGVGTNAVSTLLVELGGKAVRFIASVGLDDNGSTSGGIKFYVVGDRIVLWESGLMRRGDIAKVATVDLTGVDKLGLLVTDAGDGSTGDLADWCDAAIEFRETVSIRDIRLLGDGIAVRPEIMTPKAEGTPRINPPYVVGIRPGNPCLFRIPVSGDKPIRFSAEDLPAGLSLDPVTGLLTGTLTTKGVFPFIAVAQNGRGITRKQLNIVVSENFTVTPPLGWSSWRWFGETVNDQSIRSVADALVVSGLRDHGWTHISIDDSWQGTRNGPTQAIQPNDRFPDMHALADHLHGQGLKLGIASSPWITTYNGYCGGSSDNKNGVWTAREMGGLNYQREGLYTFEEADTRQWAEWGIDYMRYEWYPIDILAVERMRRALATAGRDIVYHLSGPAPPDQMGDLLRLSDICRSQGELTDAWSSIVRCMTDLSQAAPTTRPGRWTDLGPLQVGILRSGGIMRPTRLKSDEQYTQVSFWALASAPMTLVCDPDNLDEFTLNLLTNTEVMAIHQDPRGRPVRLIRNEGHFSIWLKELDDGAIAVGVFNIGSSPKSPVEYFNWSQITTETIVVNLGELGFNVPSRVRDVWRQKDIGTAETAFTVEVPLHGVALLRIRAE